MTCTRVATALTGHRSPLNGLCKPATCNRALHSLAETEYHHAVNDQDNILWTTCPACLAGPDPDHIWRLRTSAPTSAAAELADAGYRDIDPQFSAPPVLHQSQDRHRVVPLARWPTGPVQGGSLRLR